MKQKVFHKHRKFIALSALVASILAAMLLGVPTNAASGINQELNFQGRLLNAQGAIVPDGYYNIEFKIYDGGTGQATGDPGGTLDWTEDYLNNDGNGVQVKNGFLSVQLGSINPFGNQVNWNSNTLWLSMNVASTNASCSPFSACTPDGEMIPMKRLSSNAYALNSAMLGGLTSADFLQLAQGTAQTDSTANSSIFINKTGTGNILELQASGTDALTVNNSGDEIFGNNANHTISVATAATGNAGNSLTVSAGNTASGSTLAGGDLILQGGAGDGTAASGSVIVKSNTTNSTTAFTVQNASSTPILTADTTNDIVQIGSATANTNKDLLVLNSYSNATDPTNGTNGAMYYNTTSNSFRCYVNGAWDDCSGAHGSFVTLQSGTPGTADTGSFNVSGTGIAGTLQGSTSVLTPLLDSATASTALAIGSANASEIDLNQNTVVASGKSLTVNGKLQVGSATANTDQYLLVLNSYSNATDPTNGVDGAMYYNTSNGVFRCYAGGSWVNCATAGGGATGNFVTLQSSTPGTADTGNFNITGTGIATTLQGSTSVLTPLLDTASAGTLAIGTTNATEIDLNQNTVIASGKSLTVNGQLQVGSATANTNQDLLVLNNYSSATDPTNGTNGAMYYNTSSDLFRCYQNGSWVDCAMAGGGATGDFVQLAPSSAQGDSSANSSIFINKTGSGNLIQLQSSGGNVFSINNSGDVSFGAANHTISVAAAASGAGNSLTISGGNAGSGNSNGGNLLINGGNSAGTGANGLVILSTPTFSTTTNDANCYTGGALVTASCTIAQSTVDNTSSVILGFTKNGLTAILPVPTNTTPGRVFYVSAAPGSSDFTLSVNGGGTGNEVSMRQNTSATMVWNGSAWGAAGASSSTDLQAAYDNTLQSAGGAELIVSHTANTNGLTIRDSTVNPVNGPLLSVQTNSAATLFSINSNVTEYSSDSGAETAGATDSTFPASTWAKIGGDTTASRYTTVGDYIATGQASVQVVTGSTANDGVKNTLNTALTPNQHYNVSFAGRLVSGSFTDLYIYYSADGSAQSVACTTDRVIISSAWTKVNCSFTAPASGITSSNAILIGQTGTTGRTFYIDNLSVTIAADYNYATDGGVDDTGNFATNWPAVGGSTVSYSNSVGNDASDSAEVVTTGANQGISNKLAVAPLSDSLYRVTVYAASTAAGFDNFTVQYTPDNGTTMIPCVDYNTQTVVSPDTQFNKITCYIHTDGNAVTSPHVYFTQTDSTARTFYVDTFSLTLATDKTPNIQIGGGQEGGPTTLFTLDSAASAPIASNNEQLLGSMYYDTTLGKIQCYEATGWGSCGSASNTIVTISPEYTNAVMHGNGVGTMTSDICSGTLNINNGYGDQPTICGPDETYNFYKWTSPQASAQTYSIYVTYQLPTTFNNFLAAQTSLMGRTDSTNSTVRYTIWKDTTSGLTQCGSTIAVSTGSVSSWQIGKADGAADPSTCSFAPGNSIVFKIDVVASQDADAYVGNLNFTFTNK